MPPTELERARSIVRAAAESNHAARRLNIDAGDLASARQSFAAAARDDEDVLVATTSVLLTSQHVYANLLRVPLPLRKVVLVTDDHHRAPAIEVAGDPSPRQILKINGMSVAEDRYIPVAFLKAALEQLGEDARRAVPAGEFADDEFVWIAAASARSGENAERTAARLRAVGASELFVRLLVSFMHERFRRRRFGGGLLAALLGLGAWAATAVLAYGAMLLFRYLLPNQGIILTVGFIAIGGLIGLTLMARGLRLAAGREHLPEQRLVQEWVTSRRVAAASKQ